MRRIAVLGPNPPCGALTDEGFVEQLSRRLGLQAFALRPSPGLLLPAAAQNKPADTLLDADTLIWLSFSPGVYARDWLAGWLDVLLNGMQGKRRRARRARLLDVLRVIFAPRPAPLVEVIESLRARLRLLQLTTPEQAHFWLSLQEQRLQASTLPPRE